MITPHMWRVIERNEPRVHDFFLGMGCVASTAAISNIVQAPIMPVKVKGFKWEMGWVVVGTAFFGAPDFGQNLDWPRGSTGVQRYGCIPRSAANNLGEIPQKLGAPNPLFRRVLLGRGHIGTRPC